MIGDRIRIDGEHAEICGFKPDETIAYVYWLLSADEFAKVGIKSGVRHGNFLRMLPTATVPLTSLTELQHAPADKSGSAATIKITHQGQIKDAPSISDKKSLMVKLGEEAESFASVPVASYKGRWRPKLYGTDMRWNAGEQKKLLLFLRRVWPTCIRPTSVTIPMDPPAQKDKLAELDLLKPVVRKLGARATLHLVEGADHSFHVPKRSGRNDGELMAEVLDTFAAWIARFS